MRQGLQVVAESTARRAARTFVERVGATSLAAEQEGERRQMPTETKGAGSLELVLQEGPAVVSHVPRRPRG